MSIKGGGQNKRGVQRFFLNLTKRDQNKCGGQNNRTASDKKKKILIFKIVSVTNKNVTERFISKLGTIFWAILGLFLPLSPVNNHKKSF